MAPFERLASPGDTQQARYERRSACRPTLQNQKDHLQSRPQRLKIAKPLVTGADGSPVYWQVGNLWQMVATGVQIDNTFTLIDQVVAARPGSGILKSLNVLE